ncbi:complex I assembly factor TIMMDC1, mitochondrial [Gastrophryne carolinensis]
MTGLMAGFVYGGVPAARFSREQYIKNSQADVYLHRVDAVRSAHNAAIRGFIRYGFRWGWRVAAFVTIFNGISFTLSAYRDKVVMSHFAAAGAVTGGLFRMNLGLRGLVGGAFLGGMLGVPVGAVTAALQAVVGENIREQRRRRRRHEYEEKLKEWSDCVQLTDVLVEKIQKAESPESEVQRIDALLQQPRNPEQ